LICSFLEPLTPLLLVDLGIILAAELPSPLQRYPLPEHRINPLNQTT
jgi:hypothetical protein